MCRNLKLRLAAAFLLTGAALPQAGAQPPQDQKYRILTLDYQKPEPGKARDYVRVERELWKPVHQDRVNKAKITSWKLYEVSFPNGEDQEYDYVTMTEFAHFADLESPYEGTDFKTVLGDQKYNEMRGMTNAVRKLRRKDTLAILMSTENWSKASNKMLSVHYLKSKPQKSADLLKVQKDLYLPSNEDRIKAGSAISWATTFVRFPEQLDGAYNYVSFNGSGSMAEIEKEPSKDWLDKWNPQYRTMMPMLNASRKRVRGELWRLIDQTASK